MNTPTTLRTMRASAQLRNGAASLLAVSRPLGHPSTLPSALALHLRRAHASYSRDDKSALRKDTDTNTADTELYSPALNPPASTRPAPLNLPQRDPQASTFSHLLATGKAYISFYKTGLKAVFANRRLLRETLAAKPEEDRQRPSVWTPTVVPASYTRADWLLLWRVRHDMFRVPLFGLVLLVCGEFTPLVVLMIDGVVPYTCRLPRQIAASMAKAEERRSASLEQFEAAYPQGVLSPDVPRGAVQAHVLRSLHIVGVMWDKLGFIMPGLWQVKGNLRVAFLEGDDRLLMQDGRLSGLEPEEVRIACAERGIDVMGKGDGQLRQLLGDWLRLTADEDVADRRKRMTVLLTTRVDNWPTTRNFALPEWHL
ncbi:hypothetical protein ACHAQA_001925 [Verticillium albo-atrum]